MTNMFNDMDDIFTPKRHSTELKEFGDLTRRNICPNCNQEYRNWENHVNVCPAPPIKNIPKEIPLFQEQIQKTEAEQLAELRQEIANLKRKLNVE